MRKNLSRTLTVGVIAMLMLLGGQMLKAQNAPDGPPPPDATEAGPGGPPPQGPPEGMRPPQFDPARMQEMMLERLKDRLDATDDEWTAIKPLLTDTVKLQMESGRARMGGMMGMGRNRGRRGPGGQDGMDDQRRQGMRRMMGQPMPEAEALQSAIETSGTANSVIKAKMTAYREARQKQEEALKASREKLRSVLTLRQEAELVLIGILD